jgi:hypothetical protein
MVPALFGLDLRYTFLQNAGGDVTILPELSVGDYWNIGSDPTLEMMQSYFIRGERATWSCLARIKNHFTFERTLNECYMNLLQEKGRSEGRALESPDGPGPLLPQPSYSRLIPAPWMTTRSPSSADDAQDRAALLGDKDSLEVGEGVARRLHDLVEFVGERADSPELDQPGAESSAEGLRAPYVRSRSDIYPDATGILSPDPHLVQKIQPVLIRGSDTSDRDSEGVAFSSDVEWEAANPFSTNLSSSVTSSRRYPLSRFFRS